MGIEEVRWPRRVRPDLIRRLYALDARGIIDGDLIDEVGYAFLARCEAIRTVTRAHLRGEATCPRCRSLVSRRSQDWHDWRKDEPLGCACGWNTTWGDYQLTYRRKQLVGGNAYPAFLAFAERWPVCRSPRDKMLAIDRLLHACHVDARQRWARPAACNVLEGRMSDLIPFLDELAYGPQSTPGIVDQRREWEERPQLQHWRRWRAGELATSWPEGIDPESSER